MKTESVLNYI